MNKPFSPTEFGPFLEHVGPHAVFFDEFGKIYNNEDLQAQLLPFFDSAHAAKRLVVVTDNSDRSISDANRNRPGRFHYLWRFIGLEQEFVRAYIDDYLVAPFEYKEAILQRAEDMRTELSFDILRALVWEANTYHGTLSPAEVLAPLNAEVKPVSYGWAVTFMWSEPFPEVSFMTNTMQYARNVSEVREEASLYSVTILVKRETPKNTLRNPGAEEDENDNDDKNENDSDCPSSDELVQLNYWDHKNFSRYASNFNYPEQFLIQETEKRLVYRFPFVDEGRVNFSLMRELGIFGHVSSNHIVKAFKQKKNLHLDLVLERVKRDTFRSWTV